MKISKVAALVAAGVLVAALGLFGCSSSSASSKSSASGSASASASSASASASSASADATQIKLIQDGKLLVGTSPDYPPFENLEGDEYVGLDIELINKIAEKLGLEVEFVSLQFDAIIPAVAAGGQVDLGISGFTVDPKRAEEIDFTSSYIIDDQAIAVMKGSDITAENVDDKLASGEFKIAVQTGTSGETYVNENYGDGVALGFGNSNDAFAAMQSGQADAVCTNKAVVENMLADAYTDAEVVKTIATGEEYAIVVSKANPALTAAINGVLAEFAADGTLDALIEKYL